MTFEHWIYMYAIGVLILWPVNVVWAFRDARKRGRSGLLVAFFVSSTFPMGVLYWLIARPDKLDRKGVKPRAQVDPEEEIKRRANAGTL